MPTENIDLHTTFETHDSPQFLNCSRPGIDLMRKSWCLIDGDWSEGICLLNIDLILVVSLFAKYGIETI